MRGKKVHLRVKAYRAIYLYQNVSVSGTQISLVYQEYYQVTDCCGASEDDAWCESSRPVRRDRGDLPLCHDRSQELERGQREHPPVHQKGLQVRRCALEKGARGRFRARGLKACAWRWTRPSLHAP
eukprot:g51060.t1